MLQQAIEQEVADLMRKIDSFRGAKTDKEYLFLDEMLTRNLLILDSIETGGREDIRQMRRDSIKTINRCLSMLDRKAGGGSAKPETNNIEEEETKDRAEENNEILASLAEKSGKE